MPFQSFNHKLAPKPLPRHCLHLRHLCCVQQGEEEDGVFVHVPISPHFLCWAHDTHSAHFCWACTPVPFVPVPCLLLEVAGHIPFYSVERHSLCTRSIHGVVHLSTCACLMSTHASSTHLSAPHPPTPTSVMAPQSHPHTHPTPQHLYHAPTARLWAGAAVGAGPVRGRGRGRWP